MANPFSTGDKLTASALNTAVSIGEMVLTVPIISNSSTWNSATKVLGPGGTFAAVSGVHYAVVLDAVIATGAGVSSPSFAIGLVYKAGGAAAATDTKFHSKPITCVTSQAFYPISLHGVFQAASTGTYGVAGIGYLILGSGSGYFNADGADSLGRLNVYRVLNP